MGLRASEMALAFDGGAYPQPSRMIRTRGFGLAILDFRFSDFRLVNRSFRLEFHHCLSAFQAVRASTRAQNLHELISLPEARVIDLSARTESNPLPAVPTRNAVSSAFFDHRAHLSDELGVRAGPANSSIICSDRGPARLAVASPITCASISSAAICTSLMTRIANCLVGLQVFGVARIRRTLSISARFLLAI